MRSLLTALWIVAPVALAGLTHVAVIKLNLGRSLALRPLDGGATFHGRRLLGDNKTLRGLMVMVGATGFWVFVQVRLAEALGGAGELAPQFERTHPLVWGALAGAGYVAGELPNSFVKRRHGIAAGATATGRARAACWVVDQVDSLAGVLAFLYPVWHPAWAVVAALFAVTLLLHPAVALLMFCLGLKTRIG